MNKYKAYIRNQRANSLRKFLNSCYDTTLGDSALPISATCRQGNCRSYCIATYCCKHCFVQQHICTYNIVQILHTYCVRASKVLRIYGSSGRNGNAWNIEKESHKVCWTRSRAKEEMIIKYCLLLARELYAFHALLEVSIYTAALRNAE